MEKQEFLKKLITFLKEEKLFGEFISECLVTSRFYKISPLDYAITELEMKMVIDKSLEWAATKRGWNFYNELQNKWLKVYNKKE